MTKTSQDGHFKIACCVCLCIGLLLGFILSRILVLKYNELDLGDMVSLCVSLSLFLFVNVVFTRQSGNLKAKKDIILRLADQILASLTRLDETFQRMPKGADISESDRKTLILRIQDYSNAVHSFEQALDRCGWRDKVAFTKAKEDMLDYKATLTDGPWPLRFPESVEREQRGRHTKAWETIHGILIEVIEI